MAMVKVCDICGLPENKCVMQPDILRYMYKVPSGENEGKGQIVDICSKCFREFVVMCEKAQVKEKGDK